MEALNGKRDIGERATKFGIDVIRLCKTVPETTISRPIIGQLIRSSTSIGANYAEAKAASSRKDFANKVYIARKEAQETTHWIKIIAELIGTDKTKILSQECLELTLIFQKTTATLRSQDSSS